MGHISLAVPVAHIEILSLPTKKVISLPTKKLDQIIYYERYVVIQAGAATELPEKELQKMDFLTEEEYLDILDALPKENQYLEDSDPNKFIAKMGAEAINDLLASLNLEELSYSLRDLAENETSVQRKNEALKRLRR